MRRLFSNLESAIEAKESSDKKVEILQKYVGGLVRLVDFKEW